MRIYKNTLNNMIMDNQRKTPLYQTIITDLAITGNMNREDAEMLLGYEIPDYLKTPDGRTINTLWKKTESNSPAQGSLAKLKDIE